MARNRRPSTSTPPAAASKSPAPDIPDPSVPVAPWPLIDRYPTVLGSNLTHAFISAALRAATQGYRQQLVDVLDELLEREPTGYALLAQRVLMVAGARRHVKPAEAEPGSPDEVLALQAAKLVEAQLAAIPHLTQHIAALAWAIYYGPVALEVLWDRVDMRRADVDVSWWATRFQFIHSRRLSYPDQGAWRLHIWDQGAVSTNAVGSHPTEQVFGLAVDDYPFKFIVHVPQLRGDYPTRDGLGRELIFWFSLKGMAARSAGQTVERFAKPWAIGSYNTGTRDTDGKPRTASKPDIDALDAALRALGIGSLASASLPDSVAVNLKWPETTSSIGHKDFIAICDQQIARCISGNADLMQSGPNGARAAMQVQKRGTLELARYDASGLGATMTEHFARPVVLLNLPKAAHLIPTIEFAVDEEPDPLHVAEVAAKAVSIAVPVDADRLGAALKLPLVPNETGAPRVCVPLKPTEPTPQGEPPPPETEQDDAPPLPPADDTEDDGVETDAPE